MNAVDKIVLLTDQGRNELCAVDRAAAHCFEVRAGIQIVPDQLIRIVHHTRDADCKCAEVRAHNERLRILVTDAADRARPAHLPQVFRELRTKRRILNVVDRTLKPFLLTKNDETRPPGA